MPRQDPDPNDNWGQFGTKPTSEFVTNCSQSNPQNCKIQKSLTPAQSINCIEPSPGLKVELWASEEMPGNITSLMHITFDERGRVWAVEPKSYPNIIRTASSSITDQKFVGGADRIVILEDTDGDKVMDKFKVFRDGLNLPQSIEVVNGGVVVSIMDPGRHESDRQGCGSRSHPGGPAQAPGLVRPAQRTAGHVA